MLAMLAGLANLALLARLAKLAIPVPLATLGAHAELASALARLAGHTKLCKLHSLN